jgi:hypothetical protein
MIEIQRNPTAMREIQRSHDRQLANIEMLPGGFNALQRMYRTLEPLDDAQGNITSRAAEVTSNNLARRLGVEPVTPGQMNTSPLPNPWSPTPRATENNDNMFGGPNPFAFFGPSSAWRPMDSFPPARRIIPLGSWMHGVPPRMDLSINHVQVAETQWPIQLQHMQDMGLDKVNSAKALVKTEGNLDAAVEEVIQSMDFPE